MRYKIIIIGFLILLLFTGFSTDEMIMSKPSSLVVNPNEEFGMEYFSTDKNLVLYYDSNFGESKSVVKKEGETHILDMRSDDFLFIQDVIIKNDSIYLTRLEEEVDVLLFISAGLTVTYNEPALRIPFPMKAGQTWKWEGTEYIDGEKANDITISGQLLGVEDITTPVGKFECIKIQTDIHKKSGAHTVFYEWRTPKVGLVKLEAYIDTKGFIGTIMDLLGYDSMYFNLKKIES